jgi:hypothetical protein
MAFNSFSSLLSAVLRSLQRKRKAPLHGDVKRGFYLGPDLFVEEIRVDLSELLPFGRQCGILVDGFDGALGFASAAGDALIGVDEHLGIIVSTMDAIHGTNFDASLIFYTDARFCNDI